MFDLRSWLMALAAVVLTAGGAGAQATLTGTVVDGQSGEPLPLANVYVEQLARGAAADLDGVYRLAGLPAGTYTVRFSYAGYTTQNVTDVTLADGEARTIDVGLTTETLDEVTVTASAVRDNNAALLRLRQRAPSVSDAIGADAIARAGASTASDALGKVTGASVVGGRYVVMRGLQGRYLNVQLNGSTVPSADPDNNAVPLDLFPTGLLDNIVTTKTFTPDRSGDFTGGSVNLSTRDFPSTLTGSLGLSTGFESTAQPGTDVLAVPGARLGLFGRPSGDLGLPAAADGEIPDVSLSLFNDANAQRLDAVTDAFSPTFAPDTRAVPVDQGVSFSVGNQVEVAGRPLGFIGGVNWSRSYDGFEGGRTQTFKGLRNGESVVLVPTFSAAPGSLAAGAAGGGTAAGSEEVLYGGLANLSYGLSSLSRVGLNLLYNRSAEVEAFTETGRYLDGTLEDDATRQARSLLYQDRSIASAQLRGEHALSAGGVRVDWAASAARTSQDEPDYRIFINDVTPTASGDVYRINTAAYTAPTRFFRDLSEATYSATTDVTVPLALFGDGDQLKLGGAVALRDRSFRERTFQLLQNDARYTGDPVGFFGPGNSGLIGRNGARNVFGNYIADATSPQADYDGDQQVYAGYAMATLNLSSKLRAITGARVETTDMAVDPVNLNNPALRADLSSVDVLPSLNLVYALSERTNLRAAYGRTLARPNFRELAPYAAFELRTNRVFLGNPDLRRTLVDNADLRFEWFARPGEIVAVSGYYKRFQNPIELTYNVQAVNAEVQPRNLENANVYGLELEARRGLDGLPGPLRYLSVGGNLTLATSAVEVREDERQRRLDPSQTERPLQGQSPFVLNLDLGYETPAGTSVGLFYNLFGSRLNFVALGLTPDVYEQARGSLDLTVRQPLVGGVALRATAKNLTGARYRLVQELGGETFVTEEYPLGQSFSVGVSYGF